MTTLRSVEGGYPKIRDLRRLLGPQLNLLEINTILRYLERSKRIETDLDGNIIWIREENSDASHLRMAERASMSKEFLDLFSKESSTSGQGHSAESEDRKDE